MSRFSLLLGAGLVLATTPVLAAPFCQQAGATEDGGPAVSIIDDAPEPIFVEVGAEASLDDQVRFEIRLDGAVLLTETIALTEAPALDADELGHVAPTPAVEFLAAQPTRLAYLRRAAEAGSHVDIAIHRGDADLGVVSFETLDERSASLLETTGVAPFGLRSTVDAPATRRQLKFDCPQYCDDEQDDCYLNRCGQFGSASCYDACDRQWEDCMESCGFCQPSSSSTTTTTIVSTTATSSVVCTRSFFNSQVVGRQRAYTRRLKDTTTTTTTNSDCSQTVTTQVSYRNTLCWQWINFNPCSFPIIENPAANC